MSSKKPRVLFVCLGNIIRSPLCEGMLRHKYGNKVIVDSAACTSDDLDSHPMREAQIVAKKHGFDISSHVSRLVKKSDFENFDLIVSLERYVFHCLDRMKPKKSTAEIVEFAPGVDIINPWYESLERFNQMYDQIEKYFPEFIEKNLPELL